MQTGRIVTCGGCAQKNRVNDQPIKGRFRCGRCGAPIAASVPSLRGWWGSRGPTAKGALLIVGLGYALVGFPASAWLGLCILAAFLLKRFAASIFSPEGDSPKAIVRPACRLALLNLSRVTVYVGFGAGLVGLARGILLGLSGISAGNLRDAERLLSDLRSSIDAMLGFQNLLIGLGVALAITMVFPRSKLVAGLVTARSMLGRVYLVILGVTSFTFFSMTEIAFHELTWQQRARNEARLNLGKMEHLSREIVKNISVGETLRRLPKRNRKRPFDTSLLRRARLGPDQRCETSQGALQIALPVQTPTDGGRGKR